MQLITSLWVELELELVRQLPPLGQEVLMAGVKTERLKEQVVGEKLKVAVLIEMVEMADYLEPPH
eukprot:gene39528-48186_t